MPIYLGDLLPVHHSERRSEDLEGNKGVPRKRGHLRERFGQHVGPGCHPEVLDVNALPREIASISVQLVRIPVQLVCIRLRQGVSWQPPSSPTTPVDGPSGEMQTGLLYKPSLQISRFYSGPPQILKCNFPDFEPLGFMLEIRERANRLQEELLVRMPFAHSWKFERMRQRMETPSDDPCSDSPPW